MSNIKQAVADKIIDLAGLKRLERGCEVRVSKDFGIQGYENVQCVKRYSEALGEVSLYGHNECGKSYNVVEIVGLPINFQDVLRAAARMRMLFVDVDGVMTDTKTGRRIIYNFSIPFDQQSDKVFEFLAGVLSLERI